MDVDRELFIQQLVAALQDNYALSGNTISISSALQSSTDSAHAGSSSESAVEGEKSSQEHTGLFLSDAVLTPSGNSDRLARDAYMQLQFDYPRVQDDSIEALAELYRHISTKESMGQIATKVPITATLLESVAFLNDQRQVSTSNEAQRSQSSEASGLLAASILLLVFRTCLEVPEDARVDALLSSFTVGHSKQVRRFNMNECETMKEEKDELVEKFAAQEDPDDLGEIFEGHLPKPRSHCNAMRIKPTPDTSTASKVEKLQYLASHTFSSSFESVSVEKWEQWRLDDDLVAIIKLLIDQQPSSEARKDKHHDAPIAPYGPQGEWTRYLYILRDRILRFPGASQNTLWRLKELIEFLQRHQTAANAANTMHHIIYHVLAELAISRKFQQKMSQRAQQGMTLVIQELIPLMAQEIHALITAFTHQREIVPEHELDSLELIAGDTDERVVVVLQLLHFMLYASSSKRTSTEIFHKSGMLRTLLMLFPSTSELHNEQHEQVQDRRWFPALVRLLGECALWHADFTAYIARVPRFLAMFSTLREQLVVEQLLLALAFRQHQVQLQTTSTSRTIDVWEVFTSESLFPLQCKSYPDAMTKLQDTVFILDCLEKALASLRPAMQKELQQSLQQIYSRFGRSFEYPTFAAADAARQQQRFSPQAVSDKGHDEGSETKEKKEEYRGQTETLQFTALRNKLRQSVKSVLIALSSGSAMAHIGGRMSSKFD